MLPLIISWRTILDDCRGYKLSRRYKSATRSGVCDLLALMKSFCLPSYLYLLYLNIFSIIMRYVVYKNLL